jgi:TolA-binding protein
LAQYWLGEISYIRKDYATSIDQWKNFQILNGAINLKEYDLSNYALGYAYFQRKEKDDYTNAQVSFRKFLLTKSKYDDLKIADATIRVADCYFKNGDFKQASDYYETAIVTNKSDVDYAIYQKSLCDGVNKNYKEKINELKKIESRYPNSNYYSAAINEIADTYFKNLKDDDSAILYYNKIIKNYPNSSFANNAYAQLGNIYFNKKQDEKAFEYYDKFVQSDTKSDAAKEVLEAIRKIFQAKGDVEGMEKYFAKVGNPLSENQLEKETYNAAYDAYYNQKNCDLAIPKWEVYISKFPNGKYINEAQFCLAECTYSKNQFEKALTGYIYIVNKPRSIYSETSLAKASYIHYKDKKYAEALPLFQQLQEVAETPSNKSAGRFGAMRSAFYINNYETALQECNKVVSTEKLSPQQVSEAKYIKAKSLFETNRLNDALLEFKDISKTAKNVTGAEAFYHIGKIQYIKGEYKDIDKTVNKIISYPYTNEDWNNKGMLLLADAYISLKELSNAKIILQTIIGGKGKQEFIDEAQLKLKNILEAENQRTLSPEPDNTELKIENKQSNSDKDLFDKLYEESQKKQTTTTEQPK